MGGKWQKVNRGGLISISKSALVFLSLLHSWETFTVVLLLLLNIKYAHKLALSSTTGAQEESRLPQAYLCGLQDPFGLCCLHCHKKAELMQ